MNRFVLHLTIYILLTGTMIVGLCLFGGPYTDPFYLRFTTGPKKSLVIGTSRAAQGIIPSVMLSTLNKKGWGEGLYNYSFTVKSSSFGEPYLNSIKKKLDISLDKNKALFIIAVDPWSISTMFTDTLNHGSVFREQKFAPGNMEFVSLNPNPEYIFKNLDNRPLMILRTFRHVSHPLLESDGSLNVNVNRTDSEILNTTKDRLAEYEFFAKKNKLSTDRLYYLNETVEYLSSRGRCVLIRIPVNSRMFSIEKSFMPTFDSIIKEVAMRHNVSYLDFMYLNDELKTLDGNHLTRQDAVVFSSKLAKDLVELDSY